MNVIAAAASLALVCVDSLLAITTGISQKKK